MILQFEAFIWGGARSRNVCKMGKFSLLLGLGFWAWKKAATKHSDLKRILQSFQDVWIWPCQTAYNILEQCTYATSWLGEILLQFFRSLLKFLPIRKILKQFSVPWNVSFPYRENYCSFSRLLISFFQFRKLEKLSNNDNNFSRIRKLPPLRAMKTNFGFVEVMK